MLAGAVAAALAIAAQAASKGGAPAAREAAPAEAPIVAEARAFMESYAVDLRSGDRAAIAARYDRRGAYRLGGGRKHHDSHAAIVANYATQWAPPAAFEWRDLSFEPAGPDAVIVAGTFLWTVKAGDAPLVYSYTGLLVRQDGVLRIRLEDEDPAPRER